MHSTPLSTTAGVIRGWLDKQGINGIREVLQPIPSVIPYLFFEALRLIRAKKTVTFCLIALDHNLQSVSSN